ncbi:MAG: hypothetical protein ACRC0S_09385 [Fusobacteriaceae bacterium]
MPSIVAFTILISIFAIGEYIALKTKATFSTVLVSSVLLLLGFFMGMPKDLFVKSGILPIGGILIGILITGMGNLLDFAELKRQWKTVAVSICTVIMATSIVFLVGQLILGRDLALAGAPIFAGSSTASLVMNTELIKQGKDNLALFVILMLVCQTFVGVPLASYLLKIAAKKFKNNEDERKLYLNFSNEIIENRKRKILELPADFDKPSFAMAKLGVVTVISFYISEFTNGTLNYIVVALILGTIFTELGFLEKNILEKTKASGFIYFACIMLLFTNLTKAEPSQLLSLIFPLISTLTIGALGACLAGYLFGKIFKVETYMAICMCLTCMFGFPTTMFMSNEVAVAIGANEEDVKVLENYLRPKMITAGFVTGIFSIIISGIVVNFI